MVDSVAFNFMGVKPQDLERLLKKLGITIEELDVAKIIVELKDGSHLVFENPALAAIMKHKDQPPTLYATGFYRREEARSQIQTATFTDEDVKLVAEQAGVSLEEARKALEETNGDIALAILKLTQDRSVAR